MTKQNELIFVADIWRNNSDKAFSEVQLQWLDTRRQILLNLCLKKCNPTAPINQKICLIVILTPLFSWIPHNYWRDSDTIWSNRNILNDCICSSSWLNTLTVRATMLQSWNVILFHLHHLFFHFPPSSVTYFKFQIGLPTISVWIVGCVCGIFGQRPIWLAAR